MQNILRAKAELFAKSALQPTTRALKREGSLSGAGRGVGEVWKELAARISSASKGPIITKQKFGPNVG